MAEDSGSKTEKATPKKRRDQRKEGNVFQSKDVVTVVTLFGSFYMVKLMFPSIYRAVSDFTVKFIGFAGSMTEASQGNVKELSMMFVETVARLMLPIFLVCMALGILSTGVQTKFLFSKKSMSPKLSRLNPIQGIKNLFSPNNLIELLKSIIKLAVILGVVYSLIQADMVQVVRTMDMDVKISAVYMLNMVMSLLFRVCLAFVVIAGVDYFYQWWNYERKIKMTKQEVKEEFKQTEGNPEIKGRIKSIQRQRAMQRMMQAVPQADVIIKNPTHFAVALKYDPDKNSAPVVLAKGQDELALRIIRVGEEHHVVVVENRPLARALYASTQIGQEIGKEYYSAVAEVLVYVYKMNKKME